MSRTGGGGPLFDRYLIVDWSAASAPKRGADSLWWALVERRPGGPRLLRRENPPTRLEAMAALTELLAKEVAAGRRVLAGFDFSFGYPAGAAERLAPGAGAPWRRVWERLGDGLVEAPRNRSNRQPLAAALNAGWGGAGPFWGASGKAEIPGLGRRKPAGYDAALPAEFRLCETRLRAAPGPNPKSCWQLAGAGAVGAQSLTGLAALERLRRAPALAGAIEIWPFETGLAPPRAPICLAEIYPSLIDPKPRKGEVKDAAQIRALAFAFAALDQEGGGSGQGGLPGQGGLAPLFAGPADLTADERRRVTEEEGWILSPVEGPLSGAAIGGEPMRAPSATEPNKAPPAGGLRLATRDGVRVGPPALRYLRDPAAIYQESFAIVRREARLSHLPAEVAEVAVRLIHACGMVEIADRLAYAPELPARAIAALEAGAPILCDCEMVAAGIMRRALPGENEVLCTLNDPRAPALADRLETTRSAAAVTLWRERIEGAVVAIGNAPTALFHLLERLDEGWPRPAAILGFPVGFVGAAESKAALAADPRGTAFLTLRGRRGGSAMASAAVNALALLSVSAERRGKRP